MIKKIVIIFFILQTSLHVFAQNFEVISMYYDADSFRLNNAQKYILDSIVENFSNRRILINGHADYIGSEDRNQLIATQRANAALRYLVDRGFPETQVISTMGVGQTAHETHNGKDLHNDDMYSRRVDIFVGKGPLVKSKLKSVPLPDPQAYRKPESQKQEEVPKPPAAKNITNIDIQQLKVGDIVALKNITFIPGSDTIKSESYDELDNLYETLKNNPTLKIRLEGHVCCSIYPDGYIEGTPNWNLSVDRAEMVQNLLIAKGIDPDRITYMGFGHTHPIYEHEGSEQEAQTNRRVEIRIIEK